MHNNSNLCNNNRTLCNNRAWGKQISHTEWQLEKAKRIWVSSWVELTSQSLIPMRVKISWMRKSINWYLAQVTSALTASRLTVQAWAKPAWLRECKYQASKTACSITTWTSLTSIRESFASRKDSQVLTKYGTGACATPLYPSLLTMWYIQFSAGIALAGLRFLDALVNFTSCENFSQIGGQDFTFRRFQVRKWLATLVQSSSTSAASFWTYSYGSWHAVHILLSPKNSTFSYVPQPQT